MNLKKEEQYFIVSSRLQPLHKGHVEYWKEIITNLKIELILCVIYNPDCEIDNNVNIDKGKFTISKVNNPIPLVNRLKLLNIALSSDKIMNGKITVIPRKHPSFGWEQSLELLPKDRVFIFNEYKSDFDSSKVEFYKQKNEKVLVFNKKIEFDRNGDEIRKQLIEKKPILDFIPESCHDYFRNHCMKYFK